MIYLILTIAQVHGLSVTVTPFSSMQACRQAGETVKRQQYHPEKYVYLTITYSCVRK